VNFSKLYRESFQVCELLEQWPTSLQDYILINEVNEKTVRQTERIIRSNRERNNKTGATVTFSHKPSGLSQHCQETQLSNGES